MRIMMLESVLLELKRHRKKLTDNHIKASTHQLRQAQHFLTPSLMLLVNQGPHKWGLDQDT